MSAQPPTSIRERVGALRNLPPFLKLVWQTSPAISVAVIALRLIRALLPVATLYVGALIIDAVVAGMKSNDFDPIWRLLALEFALAVISDVLGRGVSLLDSLLGERFSIATSLRLMQHAATLDLEDFEDSEGRHMVCLPVVWAVIGGEMGVDRVGVHAIMVPLWFHTDAMATLTLKNIPDELHAKLKESAERNRRSLNSEILVRLESAFAAPLVDGREEARRLKAFTDRQPFLDHALIDSFKRRGRM